jgi:hypothetical protein
MSTPLWSACLSRLAEIKKNESASTNGTDVAAAIEAARGKLSAVQGKLLRLAEMLKTGLIVRLVNLKGGGPGGSPRQLRHDRNSCALRGISIVGGAGLHEGLHIRSHPVLRQPRSR